ncbi:hypothetical protein WA026_006225 [Henosepilachna vigintioctopunctata]|uniref:Uncharacterized protein n=1 Tax=Henosepilachna vigintioctopunctata TaxID=420089 RepID=A0AAW1TN95_9CUCU
MKIVIKHKFAKIRIEFSQKTHLENDTNTHEVIIKQYAFVFAEIDEKKLTAYTNKKCVETTGHETSKNILWVRSGDVLLSFFFSFFSFVV